jgi:hypothetical protein
MSFNLHNQLLALFETISNEVHELQPVRNSHGIIADFKSVKRGNRRVDRPRYLQKIMDLHGGFIASECTPGCTTFTCYFPAQKSISVMI